jgi:hypothetical protein
MGASTGSCTRRRAARYRVGKGYRNRRKLWTKAAKAIAVNFCMATVLLKKVDARKLQSIAASPAQPLPERELWIEVIRLAINDARGIGLKCRDTRTILYLQEYALRWLQSNRRTEGSFLWVCELVDLDPGAIRRGLWGHYWITGSKKVPLMGDTRREFVL